MSPEDGPASSREIVTSIRYHPATPRLAPDRGADCRGDTAFSYHPERDSHLRSPVRPITWHAPVRDPPLTSDSSPTTSKVGDPPRPESSRAILRLAVARPLGLFPGGGELHPVPELIAAAPRQDGAWYRLDRRLPTTLSVAGSPGPFRHSQGGWRGSAHNPRLAGGPRPRAVDQHAVVRCIRAVPPRQTAVDQFAPQVATRRVGRYPPRCGRSGRCHVGGRGCDRRMMLGQDDHRAGLTGEPGDLMVAFQYDPLRKKLHDDAPDHRESRRTTKCLLRLLPPRELTSGSRPRKGSQSHKPSSLP